MIFAKSLLSSCLFTHSELVDSLFQGEVEFRSVLFVPALTPTGKDDILNRKTKNIRLYVKRVFISDDFDGELVRIGH